MRPGAWTSACCMAVLIGACAKRQTGPRLVYVASPPPATSAASAPESGTWVIEEPVPPEPETAKPTSEAAPPAPLPPQRSQKPRRSGSAAEPDSTEPALGEPSVEPPPLEPADAAGGTDARRRIETTQKDLSRRVAEFKRTPLSEAEGRILDEAKAFLEQSRRALNEGDLQRADNLAHKAYLLVVAFEQRH